MSSSLSRLRGESASVGRAPRAVTKPAAVFSIALLLGARPRRRPRRSGSRNIASSTIPPRTGAAPPGLTSCRTAAGSTWPSPTLSRTTRRARSRTSSGPPTEGICGRSQSPSASSSCGRSPIRRRRRAPSASSGRRGAERRSPSGYHVAKGATKENYQEDIRYRASSLVVGRREKGAREFAFRAYPSGTFLGEQFAYGGLVLASGASSCRSGGGARRRKLAVRRSDQRRRREGLALPPGGLRARTRHPGQAANPGRLQRADLVRVARRYARVDHPGPREAGQGSGEPKGHVVLPVGVARPRRDVVETRADEPAGTGAPPSGITLPDGSILIARESPIPVTSTRSRIGRHTGSTWRAAATAAARGARSGSSSGPRRAPFRQLLQRDERPVPAHIRGSGSTSSRSSA